MSIRLGDLILDDDRVAALLELLDERVTARCRRIERAREEQAIAKRDEARYEKVCDLARQTARANGIIEGLSTAYAADATWEAFTACEGWFSPYDVDDHFDIHAEAGHYCEAWLISYASEIDTMKQERKAA